MKFEKLFSMYFLHLLIILSPSTSEEVPRCYKELLSSYGLTEQEKPLAETNLICGGSMVKYNCCSINDQSKILGKWKEGNIRSNILNRYKKVVGIHKDLLEIFSILSDKSKSIAELMKFK